MAAMEGTRNWVEMPDEIMGGMILQRLGALEILNSAQKVCTTWRRICKDPAMWKVIRIKHCFYAFDEDNVIEKLSKQAVHRSCGELIDISLKGFGTDNLLDYISRCSSKLNHLRLSICPGISARGLINALKKLPHLETLELSYIDICALNIYLIGRNCPQLKSLKMKTQCADYYGDVHDIGNSMPGLHHLKLVGTTIDHGNEVKAILNGCPHLESLDLRGCILLHVDKNLEKLCRERVKDFKFKRDEKSDMEMIDYDGDISHFYDGMDAYGFFGGSPISEEYDHDYNWL